MRLALESRWPARRAGFAPRRTRRRDDAARARSWPRSTPVRVAALAARLPLGHGDRLGDEREDDDGRVRRLDPLPRVRLAHNSSGANLVSGVASTLLEARDAELGLFEVDEGAFPDDRAAGPAAGGVPGQPLSRPARPLRRAGARSPSAGARRSRARPTTRRSSSTPTTRRSATSHASRPGSVTFGLDDPSQARPSLQHAADSKYCLRCGTPYAYAAAYVGHLGDYRCPACGHGRPPLEVAARAVELHGLEAASFDLVAPEGARRVRLAPARPLQRLQRAGGGGARPRARRLLDEIAAGLERCPRRRSGASSGSTIGDRRAAAAAREEPRRRERGRPHARRRRAPRASP